MTPRGPQIGVPGVPQYGRNMTCFGTPFGDPKRVPCTHDIPKGDMGA